MKQFITRDYNKIEVDPENSNWLIKSSNTERLANEINYYAGIPPRFKVYFPQTQLSFKDKFKIEYCGYDNLYQVLKKATRQWYFNAIKQINNILKDFTKSSMIWNQQDAKEMYQDKTWKYYTDLYEVEGFKEILNFNTIIVNGERLSNFHLIWGEIENKVRQIKSEEFPFIHGDLCFSNILCGLGKNQEPIIKFIDPRGSFGRIGNFGDQRYDYAKLMHSYYGGYEAIINDEFTLHKYNNRFDYEFDRLDTPPIDCPFKEEEIKLICGLIFIGMCSRHYDSLQRQIAMYITGVKILNEVL